MAETKEDPQSIDWAHLDTLVQHDFLPTEEACQTDNSFEQIAKIETEVVFLKQRLASGRMKGSKKLRAECQLTDHETNIQKLKAGHQKAAEILRQKSAALAALPSEMRDAILEKLYVQEEPITVSAKRVGSKYVFNMPKDSALYMSALHVGDDLARQAAEIFYKHNTFAFISDTIYGTYHYQSHFTFWDQSQLQDWLQTDHYVSGVEARDYVRHISIQFERISHKYDPALTGNWQSPDYRVSNHIYFEKLCASLSAGGWHDYRGRLENLFEMSNLRTLDIKIPEMDVRFDTMIRLMNPVIQRFRRAGVKVIFYQKSMYEGVPLFELSEIFDEPSERDYAEYYQVTQRSSVFTDEPGRDVFESWMVIDREFHNTTEVSNMVKAYLPADGNFGFIRVWLWEQGEMSRFMARDGETYETINKMADDVRFRLSSQERDLQRRFYPRVLEYIR